MSDGDNTEKTPIKKSVQIDLDLEVEASNRKIREHRFQWWIDLAEAVDAWRIFPRLFIGVYIYLLYHSIMWFIALPDPTTQQTALISVITSIGAGWFTAYVATSKKKKDD